MWCDSDNLDVRGFVKDGLSGCGTAAVWTEAMVKSQVTEPDVIFSLASPRDAWLGCLHHWIAAGRLWWVCGYQASVWKNLLYKCVYLHETPQWHLPLSFQKKCKYAVNNIDSTSLARANRSPFQNNLTLILGIRQKLFLVCLWTYFRWVKNNAALFRECWQRFSQVTVSLLSRRGISMWL